MQENGNNVIEEHIWVNKLIFFLAKEIHQCVNGLILTSVT